jgi:hypothetical protein
VTLYTPESWSFWMSLKVLVDGSNCIWRKGSIRMSVSPTFSENAVTTHVVHLLRPISFRKVVRDVGMPEEHTKCCCNINLDAKIDLLGRRCICSTMDYRLSTTCGTITYTMDLLAVVLVRFDGVQLNPKENRCIDGCCARRAKHAFFVIVIQLGPFGVTPFRPV